MRRNDGTRWTADEGDRRRAQRQAVQEQVRELVRQAVPGGGYPPFSAQRARRDLVGIARNSPHGARMVGQQLAEQLQCCVDEAWQRGWQPADLHRVVVRGLPGVERGPTALTRYVLLDAMAAQLARYAATSIDQRWWAQLAELEATTWWPASTDHLSARAPSTVGGWAELCSAALTATSLLVRLPALTPLGPLPGQADTASQAAAERAGQVDDRVLSRVRALLAKAESTTFEAEAETFTAGAQALMARHSIDAAMLDAAERQPSAPGAIRVGIDRPYENPKALLLTLVADANRCRAIWSQQLGFCTVLGFPPDLRAVETLFTSLLVQATAALQREGSRRDVWGASRTRSFRQSFLTAYASRIGERLADVASQEEQQARNRAETEQPGGPNGHDAVLPVLAARSRAVEQATADMFPELVPGRACRINDPEGWHRGIAAADQASLGRGDAIAAGS